MKDVKRYELMGVNAPGSYTGTCGKCQMVKAQHYQWPNDWQYVHWSAYDALLARAAELEADARRYRWLREFRRGLGVVDAENSDCPIHLWTDKADRAIDAALAADKETTNE
jgi:hypothetical protein